jgi:hypothetical protein
MFLLVGMLGACCKQPKQKPYEGPSDPLIKVVDDINQNNQRIQTLWAAGDFSAWIPDEKGRTHFVDGDAHLMYRAPQDLRVIGTKFGIGRVFDVGSNGQQYWMTVKPEVETIWYGDYRHSPAGATSAQQIPVRPDLMLEVLAVNTIDTDLTRLPAPVMRFNNDADAYMLVWQVKSSHPPDRWVAQKEVWYDRATKRAKLVLLFDEDGRIVLRAYLTDHKPVAGNWPAGTQPPYVPGTIDLYFPQTKTKMRLGLRDIRAASKDGLPTDASFRFPGPGAAAKAINLDEPPPR